MHRKLCRDGRRQLADTKDDVADRGSSVRQTFIIETVD